MSVALEFGFALVVILGAAVLFTNAVEILGGRLNLGQGAVDCGAGFDVVFADRADAISDDCERVKYRLPPGA